MKEKYLFLIKFIFHRYVLLKERNRLLTMEEEYRHQHELFPNPERIDKVIKISLNYLINKIII